MRQDVTEQLTRMIEGTEAGATGDSTARAEDAVSDDVSRQLDDAVDLSEDALASIAYLEAYSLLNNRDDALEIAQDAMVIFIASPVVPRTSGAWVRRIARNRAIDLIRRRACYKRLEPLIAPDEQTPPWEDPEAVIARLVLEEAMNCLPAKQRQAVTLCYLEGMDQAVAVTTGGAGKEAGAATERR